ncbi:TIGR02530 family flagellar biosynthesis protein [Paenibacillus chartarius]|uniref:TIGR02530 family flagellar biosynthesis protein n=1 Tax=Paenibacillus chartarius TaxID=747481 RepID=A0ABV6DNX8_9BACL
MERIQVGHLYPNAVAPVQPKQRPASAGSPSGVQTGKATFQDILQSHIVRFSHHAEVRLKQRGIQLNNDQLTKLGSAIDKAASKGAKDSLMLLDGTALIVNIPNRTVVTALDGASMQEHVFTQIDSAVIIS